MIKKQLFVIFFTLFFTFIELSAEPLEMKTMEAKIEFTPTLMIQDSDYQICEVPYSISPYVCGDTLHVKIKLPEEMRVPWGYFRHLTTEDSCGCYFNCNILDNEAFLDSNQNPISWFKISVKATNTDSGVTLSIEATTAVKETTTVNDEETSTMHKSTTNTVHTMDQIQIDPTFSPNLVRFWNHENAGRVSFKINQSK